MKRGFVMCALLVAVLLAAVAFAPAPPIAPDISELEVFTFTGVSGASAGDTGYIDFIRVDADSMIAIFTENGTRPELLPAAFAVTGYPVSEFAPANVGEARRFFMFAQSGVWNLFELKYEDQP